MLNNIKDYLAYISFASVISNFNFNPFNQCYENLGCSLNYICIADLICSTKIQNFMDIHDIQLHIIQFMKENA